MIVGTLEEALAPITDGCMLAVPREQSGVAMAATRALIRRGVKRLHLSRSRHRACKPTC